MSFIVRIKDGRKVTGYINDREEIVREKNEAKRYESQKEANKMCWEVVLVAELDADVVEVKK